MVHVFCSWKNKIGKFLVKAARNAGLPGNLTNHSVCKTCISRLMDTDVPENYVAQLSGHKNLKSLDSYKTATDDHQRKMSLTLSRTNTSVMPSSSSSAKEDTKKEKHQLQLEKMSFLLAFFQAPQF